MEMIGQAIRHDTYGVGVVTARTEGTITVRFDVGEKRFLYPDAFDRHLKLKNNVLQARAAEALREREEDEEARLQKLQARQERRARIQRMKVGTSAQAVFDLTEKEADEVFEHWQVSTGCYLSGYAKGKPRTPDRVKPHSMCLLTTCPEGEETERLLLGAFMVEEDFVGRSCREGVIRAHPDYRARLAQPLPFWETLGQEPPKTHWGHTVFKYLGNDAGLRLLEAMAQAEPSEELKKFRRYYAVLNKLEDMDQPQPIQE